MHRSDVDWHTEQVLKASKPIARNVQQAFGPYTSRDVYAMDDPRGSRSERIAGAIFAVVVSILSAAWIVHELSK